MFKTVTPTRLATQVNSRKVRSNFCKTNFVVVEKEDSM